MVDRSSDAALSSPTAIAFGPGGGMFVSSAPSGELVTLDEGDVAVFADPVDVGVPPRSARGPDGHTAARGCMRRDGRSAPSSAPKVRGSRLERPSAFASLDVRGEVDAVDAFRPQEVRGAFHARRAYDAVHARIVTKKRLR